MNASSTSAIYGTTVDVTTFGEIVTDFTFGMIEISCVSIGLLLNSLTIPYFSKKKKHFSNLIYLFIVAVDICTLISCLPSAVSMLNERKATMLSNPAVCSISGFVFNVASRMSVFLIALLGAARGLSILFPFTKPKLNYYFVPLGVYFAVNIFLAFLPITFSQVGYHYARFLGQCSWGIHELSFVDCYGMSCSEWRWMIIITVILPWLVPGVLVILTSSISIVMLKRSTNTCKGLCRKLNKNKFNLVSPAVLPGSRTRHATITILIMTVIYCIFNMPCWLLYSYLLGNGFSPAKWLRGDIAVYIQIFVSRLSVVLNSAVNPVVYFSRIEALAFAKITGHARRRMSKSIVSRASYALRLVQNDTSRTASCKFDIKTKRISLPTPQCLRKTTYIPKRRSATTLEPTFHS